MQLTFSVFHKYWMLLMTLNRRISKYRITSRVLDRNFKRIFEREYRFLSFAVLLPKRAQTCLLWRKVTMTNVNWSSVLVVLALLSVAGNTVWNFFDWHSSVSATRTCTQPRMHTPRLHKHAQIECFWYSQQTLRHHNNTRSHGQFEYLSDILGVIMLHFALYELSQLVCDRKGRIPLRHHFVH